MTLKKLNRYFFENYITSANNSNNTNHSGYNNKLSAHKFIFTFLISVYILTFLYYITNIDLKA